MLFLRFTFVPFFRFSFVFPLERNFTVSDNKKKKEIKIDPPTIFLRCMQWMATLESMNACNKDNN